MDELNAWTAFFTTGNVLDYLRYKSIQNSKNTGADTTPENANEVQNKRTDNQGTEYR
ncbi:MAG: hypothetical protein PUD24_00655 [Oscillospiraceae bacterium]|nr:hypothetical protein [Oscillospiraceae bacterium]